MEKKGALVIGGGIAGIQSALDLADSGIHVYLVERTPSIGGRMAQLDKTFPTNDCSMCILAPKMVDLARHPNIELLTYSEVVGVEGTEGNFKVRIKKKPRYVNEKCTGCGVCIEKCILKGKIPSEFNAGVGKRGAAYIPFPQAVPLKATIDAENCIFITKGKCGKSPACADSCEAKAIDFAQKEEEVELNVGSIIVATGYDLFDASQKKEYGYGVYPNVISALEFERILSASGPTGGKVVRPSDGRTPKSVVFINCVGSRDENAKKYCSRVCCMYNVKEALIAKEHEPSIEKRYVLFMDMRSFGKGFEDYYERAKEEGVIFIRGRASEILETQDKGLVVRVENTEKGEIEEINADLVILSPAIVPKVQGIASVLGVNTDENGFYKEKDISTHPFETQKGGIYVAGCASSPKDIPDSVVQGSGAAAKAAIPLANFRAIEEKAYEEIDVSGEPRIGVFICHCGINIGSVVDVPGVVEYAKKLPNVVLASNALYTCSDDTQRAIRDAIKKHNLNRVIVAACTPRTHEPLFRETCRKAGLNPYLFEFANIREQCSWVHMEEKEHATKKAKDLVRMAVAKARMLEPLKVREVPVERSALVIGGGIAGITAALDLSAQSFEVHLVEKSESLGGRLKKLGKLYPSNINASEVLQGKIDELKKSKVDVITAAEVTDVSGFIGNFNVVLSGNKKLKVGTIVIAVGSDVYSPTEYGYGEIPNVITNLELEEKFLGSTQPPPAKDVVFIQCVGSREKGKECSRYCCQTAIKQAIELKEKGTNVTILHRDIRTFGKYAEESYRRASEMGISFVRFPDNKKPAVSRKDGRVEVRVFDVMSGADIALNADLLVLSAAMVPNESAKTLQKMLKIPLSKDGFFMELHPKLAPVETNTAGIYICGCCQYPKDISESIAQASAAASKASIPMARGKAVAEPIVSSINKDLCIGCRVCEAICPYGAIERDKEQKISKVVEVLCKGCGTCSATCPKNAITMKHFTNDQLIAQISAMAEEE
jgi:heterodisulfide reductase subunit A